MMNEGQGNGIKQPWKRQEAASADVFLVLTLMRSKSSARQSIRSYPSFAIPVRRGGSLAAQVLGFPQHRYYLLWNYKFPGLVSNAVHEVLLVNVPGFPCLQMEADIQRDTYETFGISTFYGSALGVFFLFNLSCI